jgi:phage gpG-like protein
MAHSLRETAALFTRIALAMPMVEHVALERAGRIVEEEAKRVIGSYEYGWQPLAASTVAKKAAGDTPLLETGEMRDSIEHVVVGHECHVGSNNMKAVYQELGTSRMPPRSFLMGAAMRKEHEIHEMTGRYFHAALSLNGAPGRAVLGGALVTTRGNVGSIPAIGNIKKLK